jgi:hypothetical protein
LPRIALGSHFEGAATDLAFGGKPLGCDTRINHQIRALAAIRALNGFADFHLQLRQE